MSVLSRSEEQWNNIEESVLNSLQSRKRGIILNREFVFRSFYKPAIAFAAAFVLAISAFLYFYNNNFSRQNIAAELTILNCTGEVALAGHNISEKTLLKTESSLILKPGQILETGADGEITARLEENTGFKLSANSRIEIKQSDKSVMRLLLHSGEALFSVKKRQVGSIFTVQTENAECRVVGTVFEVKACNEGTTLSVFKGAVRFTDISDKQISTIIDAGYCANLANHIIKDNAQIESAESSIRDISLLTLALSSSLDSKVPAAGLVEFISVPSGASVSVNGQAQGNTPIVMQLPAGVFDVEMTSSGFEKWLGSVEVTEKHTSIVSAGMVPDKQFAADTKSPSRANRKTLSPDNFTYRPEYVEACIQITIGEYHKAIGILESLNKNNRLTTAERAGILKQTAVCYKNIGNFNETLRLLKSQYEQAKSDSEKAGILWEMSTIQASCLGDFKGAENTLEKYLQTDSNGRWVTEARARLADVRYLINQGDI
jgi:tetratricopeptide (TPR) repeat protein